MKQTVKKAIFPAAGYGTRFLPATKASPKEMMPIVDTPIIQLAAHEAIESGIEEIIIITNRNKYAIENHFDKAFELEYALEKAGKFDLLEKVRNVYEKVQVVYIRQVEMKGLGDAILTAKNIIGDEPFAVILADDVIHSKTPCLKQMIEMYDQYQAPVVATMAVDPSEVHRYGILDHQRVSDQLLQINDMIEKPNADEAPSNQAIIGRYILTPDIFDILEETQPGKGGEVQLTDALKTLLQKRKMYGFEFEGRRFDAGNVLGFLKATTFFALQRDDVKDEYARFLKSEEMMKLLNS